MLEVDGGREVAEATTAAPRVLRMLAEVVERLVARNDHVVEEAGGGPSPRPGSVYSSRSSLGCFNGARAPSISIPRYLERIFKYTSCSPSCLVVAFIYMDRLVHRHPYFLILSLNVHRLLLTSVLLASKVLDDVHHSNAFYAKVGGISNGELNKLELELLFLLDFSVAVSSSVFESYCLHLEKEAMCGSINGKLDRNMSSSADDETEIRDASRSTSPPPSNVID